jgi:glyoxylase-like metal-dependent hydrolase (beta-lactamase superfamily II)
MFNEIIPNVYQIGVPLAGSPLKMTNAYLIKRTANENGRHLLIDNGFNQPEGRAVLLQSLDELGVRLEDLDFFITHVHADHNGLTPVLCKNKDSIVWASPVDADIIERSLSDQQRKDSFLNLNDIWEQEFVYMRKNGVSMAELEELLRAHPAKAYSMSKPVRFTAAGDGDVLKYGRFNLRVISVPGHSPGQIALYDEQEKIFFAGDHILANITPNIGAWGQRVDYLAQYLQSLDKVARMDIALTLPGHRVVIHDTRARIAELKKHHAERLNEVRGILKKEARPLTAYTVASKMHWSLRYSGWDEYPVPQKWFATGEASTHLVYLLGLGEIAEEDTGALTLYSCN